MSRFARTPLSWTGDARVLSSYLALVAAVTCLVAGSTSCGSSVRVVEGSSAGAYHAGGGALVGGLSATAGAQPGGAGYGAGTAGTHAGGSSGGFGAEGGGIPADGASTACQLLWSIGIWWWEQPNHDNCVSCFREMTGEDEVSLTPCSVVGTQCAIDAGCHDMWICLANAAYDPASIEACFGLGSPQDQALFVAVADCVVIWCGGPDRCAYSGATPGCELEAGG